MMDFISKTCSSSKASHTFIKSSRWRRRLSLLPSDSNQERIHHRLHPSLYKSDIPILIPEYRCESYVSLQKTQKQIAHRCRFVYKSVIRLIPLTTAWCFPDQCLHTSPICWAYGLSSVESSITSTPLFQFNIRNNPHFEEPMLKLQACESLLIASWAGAFFWPCKTLSISVQVKIFGLAVKNAVAIRILKILMNS